MKKNIIFLLSVCVFTLFLSSCLEDYLDKAPESGLTQEEVFSKYANFKLFFDAVYNGQKKTGTAQTFKTYNIKTGYPLFLDMWDQKSTWESHTDNSDEGRRGTGHKIKMGILGANIKFLTYENRPILGSMFNAIRICNLALKNINLVSDASQKEIDDFIAQAHFVRAFAHFELLRFWGPMPYLTKVIGPYDQWDMPRLSKHETLIRIAADMDSAAFYFKKANLMRRDPGPGIAGHLNDPDQWRPNGVAAKAYKARALLYAASPLNNETGNISYWEEAAKANWEAIQIAEEHLYALLPAIDYKQNYIGVKYTNEQLWGWNAGTFSYSSSDMLGLMNGVFQSSKGGSAGECPTQNMVDKFETSWGEPLKTDADRQAAAAAGHYKEQDPYVNRDPRFYIDIIYNQAPGIIGYTNAKAQIYYTMVNGKAVYAELQDQSYLGITKTGYYQRKRWGDNSVKNKILAQHTDPLIRLGELYLNYAEAANEAYGPNTPAPGATLTAAQAINIIRSRIGMVNVLPQFIASKDAFRPRIKNERTIELCFEGHYYHDIRRWKDAPAIMSGILYGVDIEKVAVSPAYPSGFKYIRYPLPSDRQIRWIDAMYYLPFSTDDNFKMKNFVPNEVW